MVVFGAGGGFTDVFSQFQQVYTYEFNHTKGDVVIKYEGDGKILDSNVFLP